MAHDASDGRLPTLLGLVATGAGQRPRREEPTHVTAHYTAVAIGHTGRGNFGHNLHLTFNDNPRVTMVAIADPDETGRTAAQVASGAERAYADYQTMLSRERPDIVVIGPHWFDHSREEHFLAACESGARGIYVEKPIASSLVAADRMLAAADRRGIRVVVAHRSRENPYLWWARDTIRSGKYGRLRLMRGQGKADQRAGAYDTMVLGTHIFDQMRFFAGEVAWAWGRVTQDGRDVTPADFFEGELGTGLLAGNGLDAYYAFQDGVAGTYESYQASDGSKANQWFGLDLYCEHAIIALRNLPGSEVYRYSDGVLFPQPHLGAWQRVVLPDWPPEPGDAATNPAAARAHAQTCMATSNRLIGEELVRCIEENREPIRASSGHDAVAALEMVLAPHESQRIRMNVSFPLHNREQPNEYWQRETTPSATSP
jgi:predicted dehydrogenase